MREVQTQPAMPSPVTGKIYQLKVTLAEIVPPIWRRFCVPGSMKLSELHETLQIVMGWENYHLHCFKIDGLEYGSDGWRDPAIEEVIPAFRAPRGRQVASRRLGKIRTVFYYE